MKVLILSKDLAPGGAERQLAYIAECISKNCYVEFLLFEEKGTLLSYIKNLNIKINTINRNVSFWKLSRSLRQYIINGNYSHIITFLPECNLLNEIAGLPYKNWKVIAGARSADPSFLTNFKRRIYYYAHIFADIVISNSQKNKDDILAVNKFINSDKIKILYNIFRLNTINSEYIPFKNNKINIIIAANYRPVKNIMGLLEALSIASKEIKDKLHFEWYGLKTDNTYIEAKQYIIDNKLFDIIDLHDRTDNVLDVYNQADVVALFSHFEGLPNAICEALIIGKPVLCTPVSDLPYILKNTKNFICNSSSKDDIKDMLETLAKTNKGDLIEIGNNNKEHFSSFFNTEKTEKQLLSFL